MKENRGTTLNFHYETSKRQLPSLGVTKSQTTSPGLILAWDMTLKLIMRKHSTDLMLAVQFLFMSIIHFFC